MAVYGEEKRFEHMKVLAKEIEVDGVPVVPGDPIPATQITVATFTTAGETEISGNLQEVLEAIADLADPAA